MDSVPDSPQFASRPDPYHSQPQSPHRTPVCQALPARIAPQVTALRGLAVWLHAQTVPAAAPVVVSGGTREEGGVERQCLQTKQTISAHLGGKQRQLVLTGGTLGSFALMAAAALEKSKSSKTCSQC